MSVSTSYAKALYEAAKENKDSSEVLDQIGTQLEDFQKSLESSKELRVALLSPVTTAREKVKLIEDVAQKMNFSPIAKQFIALMGKKGRLTLLKEISDAFRTIRLTSEGGVPGRLVAADPLSESDINTLSKAFSQKLGKKVAFRVDTDPSLLAGIKVTVNGVTYDGTLRSQIQKLRDQFVAGLPGAHI